MSISHKGVQHIGIPVSDMKRSLKWYKEMLGIEPDFVLDASGEGVSQAVGVPEADFSFAFLHVGNTVVEFLEYRNPPGRPYDRGNHDIGAVHIAFHVDDIEKEYKLLCDRGIKFNTPPQWIDSGPLEGCAFCYFKDPDNIQLELFQTAK
jgi:catechol 2,3-dioxygenase-like lactoylglutathione lyase family enzyme